MENMTQKTILLLSWSAHNVCFTFCTLFFCLLQVKIVGLCMGFEKCVYAWPICGPNLMQLCMGTCYARNGTICTMGFC